MSNSTHPRLAVLLLLTAATISCAGSSSDRSPGALAEGEVELPPSVVALIDPVLPQRVPAPEFILFDQEGFPFPLAERREHWVVVHFYPDSDTPDCACDATAFTGHLWSFNSLDAEVACITSSPQSRTRMFAKKYGLQSPLLSDSDLAVCRAYGVLDETRTDPLVRTTVIVDPDGRVAARWDDVKSDEHIETVLEVLRRLREE